MSPTNNSITNSSKESVKFAAAGDFGNGSNYSETLNTIKSNNVDFTLALGDFSYEYNPSGEWCKTANTVLGGEHPFQLIAGNHELPQSASEHAMGHFTECLPNRIENIEGEYGKQYYFDKKDIARFILISPGLNLEGYNYSKGKKAFTWVSNSIDQARKEGIEWVIVAMHMNCISPTRATCNTGEDLFNLLIRKRVDLILGGHVHAYARSKPLALNEQCKSVTTKKYNQRCVKDVRGETYKKGVGATVIINGTGGRNLNRVDTGQQQIKYFKTWHGKNANPVFGPSIIKATKDLIDVKYVGNNGETYDRFMIEN